MAFNSGRFCRRFGRKNVSIFINIEYRFAFRVSGTAEKFAESTCFVHHHAGTVRADMLGFFWFEHRSLAVAWAGVFACVFFGSVHCATEEPSVFAEPVLHRCVAFGAFVFGGLGLGFCVLHAFFGSFEVLLEGFVELFEYGDPVEMLLFDLVELLFHVTGEGDVHYLREELGEFVGDDFADVRGVEASVDLLGVFSVLYRADDRSVCTGSADAFFFESLYE